MFSATSNNAEQDRGQRSLWRGNIIGSLRFIIIKSSGRDE